MAPGSDPTALHAYVADGRPGWWHRPRCEAGPAVGKSVNPMHSCKDARAARKRPDLESYTRAAAKPGNLTDRSPSRAVGQSG